MQLSFSNGVFVSSQAGFNYQKVLDDIPNAKTIRIVTYNISKTNPLDSLIHLLKTSDADIKLISNIPSRMERYFHSSKGDVMRQNAKTNIKAYFNELDPKAFSGTFFPFFNMESHAKIVGTENIVYIGSANFSNESSQNVEVGIIIKDKGFISSLYRDFVDQLCEESIPYSDECLTPFRILAISLIKPFSTFKCKLLDFYESVCLDDSSDMGRSLEWSDLDNCLLLIDKLKLLKSFAEDLCDEENNEYNKDADQIITAFKSICFDSVIDPMIEDGSLFELVVFNLSSETDKIFQKNYSFAFDEEVDDYLEKAQQLALEKRSEICEQFETEYPSLLSEIDKMIDLLSLSEAFSKKWASYRRNMEIDNTDC